MSILSQMIRDVAICLGVTLCSKCLTWTKMIKTKQIKDHIWNGHTICPKCGQKDGWQVGVDGG